VLLSLLLLMIPLPPISTLFPYTTLFRSKSGSIVNLVRSQSQEAPSFSNCFKMIPPYFSFHSQACFRKSSRLNDFLSMPCSFSIRSEEHTSELQSRENLVCRLLLEKKKQI